MNLLAKMDLQTPIPVERNRKLRIALGVPEWEPFYDVMSGRAADATYVIQGNLSRGLIARGHSLTFIAPRSPDEFIITADPCKPRVAARTWTAGPLFDLAGKAAWRAQRLLGIPYLNFFSNFRYMDACLRALKGIDLIYERNGLYNVGLAMAAQRLHLPYVIFFEADQVMELDLTDKPVTGLLRRRADQILRYNMNAADCVICVTQAGRQRLFNTWNVPAEKILVFPNAVDVDRFRPDPKAGAQVRADLGLGGEPVVIFVGNFFHWHDVSTLLKAFALCLKACLEARLVLVGDGDRRAQMAELASSLGLDHAVIFTGLLPHAEVSRYIAAADVAVVPYPPMEQEMWLSPLKLFEYMSCGKAVVASAVGQIVDMIREGENGLLVPPGDASAMAVALTKLLRDAPARAALGRQARQDALNKMSWDHYLSRLERSL